MWKHQSGKNHHHDAASRGKSCGVKQSRPKLMKKKVSSIALSSEYCNYLVE